MGPQASDATGWPKVPALRMVEERVQMATGPRDYMQAIGAGEVCGYQEGADSATLSPLHPCAGKCASEQIFWV